MNYFGNKYSDYAEEVIKTIRNNSPKAMIWVGVPGWGKNIGEAKASPIEAENIAYTFHFYAGSMADDYRRNVDKCLETSSKELFSISSLVLTLPK